MDPFQALFQQYITRTPDNRYFLPFSNTYLGQQKMNVPGVDLDTGAYPSDTRPYYQMETPSQSPEGGGPDISKYYSQQDYFNALDPYKGFFVTGQHSDGTPIAPQEAQNALVSNGATRGTYNDQLGYFFDPNSLGGAHPATTSGSNPRNAIQALSLLLPAVGGIIGAAGGAAGDAGSVGSSAFEGSIPAGSEGGSIAGSEGSSTLAGDAGTDTLSSNVTGSSGMGEDTIDDFSTGGTDQGVFSSPSQTGSDSGLWDLVSKYGGSLYKLFTLGGGNKPAGTTTTIQDIPDWQKALLMPALSQSYGLLQQQQGQSYPLLSPAQDTLGKTISGGFLNSNPYLDATYNQAAKAVTDNYNSVVRPQNDALFYKAGAFGPSNSAYDETVARNQFGLGQNLQNLATNIYGGNFAQERQNQLNASINAPAFSQASAATPWSPYQNFLSVAGGNFGGSKQEPYFQNKTGNIFGGALLGSQLFK
jgi:hypothetical protein